LGEFDAVMSNGQVIVGFSLSVTVTVKLHCAVFDEASVTMMVTVVTPTLNVCAPGCPLPLSEVTPEVVQAMELPLQLSPKVTEGMATLAEQVPEATFAVWLAGQVIVGTSVSFTVTVNEQVAVSETPSVTKRFTVVVPLLKVCVPG